MTSRLMTLTEFRRLTPRAQGYFSYMQGDLPDSPLKEHQRNPYPRKSKRHEQFAAGQQEAVLAVQDMDA